jgi:hypothetical protein
MYGSIFCKDNLFGMKKGRKRLELIENAKKKRVNVLH